MQFRLHRTRCALNAGGRGMQRLGSALHSTGLGQLLIYDAIRDRRHHLLVRRIAKVLDDVDITVAVSIPFRDCFDYREGRISKEHICPH